MDPELSRRSFLELAVSAAGGASFLTALGGCSKFPSGPGSLQAQIQVSVTMNGPINPNYLYFAVFTVTDLANANPASFGPQPVVGSNGNNGAFVIPEPTSPVNQQSSLYVALDLNQGSTFQVDAFVGPLTPVLPSSTTIRNQLPSIPVQDINGNYPATWQFTLYAQDFISASTWITSFSQIKAILVQVIAMNELAAGVASGRSQDFLGSSGGPAAVSINVNEATTQVFTNQTGFSGEPALGIKSAAFTVYLPT